MNWTPVSACTRTNVWNEMDHLLNSMVRWTDSRPAAKNDWTPSFDVIREKGKIVFAADLPGISKKDLDVTVADGVLTVKGERKTEQERNSRNMLRQEISYGKFERSFVLPEEVHPENIQAEFKNGVLKLHFQEAEQKKPEVKQIAIK